MREIKSIMPDFSSASREIKLKTYKSLNGLCESLLSGMDKVTNNLDDLDIEGRSQMSKPELVAAIRDNW